MSARPLFVLDASVGVKWFKPEAGRERALELQARAAAGEVALAAPSHFVHEVLAVVARYYAPRDVVPAWERIIASGTALLPLTDEVVTEAARQCEALGCSFYDALAPACASLFGATLASADERAHGAYPGVYLVTAEG